MFQCYVRHREPHPEIRFGAQASLSKQQPCIVAAGNVHKTSVSQNAKDHINDHLAELIDALFNQKFLDSIDDSWDEVTLLDIASYKNGLAMQKFRPEGNDPGLPVLKIKELGQGRCAADAERCKSDIDEAVRMYDGDLVFSWSGTLLLDFWLEEMQVLTSIFSR